ncbi:PLP-dependent transferase [Dentipellis sp. KUC8613]|nr:PLP-dependent transferase [Dentipellis sp. KUC8613]
MVERLPCPTTVIDPVRCSTSAPDAFAESLREAHEAAGAWFLGPKAENGACFKKFVETILDDLIRCRRDYFPEDKNFINEETVSSSVFKTSMSKLETNINFLSALLPQHSVPFFSPRYMAHMLNDVSMPATLGYLMALMYNPNNVAVEGSPLTSIIEFDVGQQLCGMLGFDVQPPEDRNCGPTPWGHITCDGSVANLESMWVARNLKFYPLSLRRAIDSEPTLAFMAAHVKVKLCTGREKLLIDCDPWELLNLTPDEIVSLPARLSAEFGISPQSVHCIMRRYLIQTTGRHELEAYFGIQQPPQYVVSKTAHYSWPKGAAITGIGSQNLIGVPVDVSARMDCEALDSLLAQCLQRHQAVFAVVAIMGTTEHGAVDPLSQILALRKKYQRRGLSFLIHADAAWGGYFTSMLVPNPASQDTSNSLDDPLLFVSSHTERELRHLRFADSVTIDPHKSGYVPYPAGSLCYRDGRLRYLVTWTSPVIDSPEDGASKMGVYGIEGSKPGAAPVAAWLGHEVIGLHKGGYGFLLGESIFTGLKMYAHWATISLDHPDLLVVPFRMLPSERSADPSPQAIDEERRYIRDLILSRSRNELAQDPMACALLKILGSDLVVNAFACNFRIDGKVNTDITEANYLNARIYEKLSFHKLADNPNDRKVVLMSTIFSQKEYGSCLTNFKRRLGLLGDGDLFVLVNVSMSPFSSRGNFESVLADAFMGTAEEEYKISQQRNQAVPALHAFILQGSCQVHLVHMPCFSSASQRRQCIMSAELPPMEKQKYLDAKNKDPSAIFIVSTLQEEELSTIVQKKSFRGRISKSTHNGTEDIATCLISHISVVKNRSLATRHLDLSYPTKMPFYLYGTLDEMHLDHILLHAPNAQLTANDVHIELPNIDAATFANGLQRGLIAVMDMIPEHLLQPFSADHRPSFFRPGVKHGVTIYHDHHSAQALGPGLVTGLESPIAFGSVTLGDSIFIDSVMINTDTPIIASHVPKRRMPLNNSAGPRSQDHPMFRGYEPSSTAEAGDTTHGHAGWRDIWDTALAQRQFSQFSLHPTSTHQ